MKKIILDTDIGSDIDDAFALAYLLSRTDIEILGITTVSGSPELRARLADRICSGFGKNIPVFIGCEKSLNGIVCQPRLTRGQTAVALSNENNCFKCDAVEFMRNSIEKYPGEVTLICIGQLTNVANLFLKYDHIPELLNSMVIMGGRYVENEFCDIERWGITEWNILCDIKAAKIVFGRGVKNSIVIGIDQTCRFNLSPEPLKAAFANIDKLSAVSDCISATVKEVYFHDAIAIYAWLHPEEVAFKTGNISVGIFDKGDNAETVFVPSKGGPHSIVSDFSAKQFWKDYKYTVGLNMMLNKLPVT